MGLVYENVNNLYNLSDNIKHNWEFLLLILIIVLISFGISNKIHKNRILDILIMKEQMIEIGKKTQKDLKRVRREKLNIRLSPFTNEKEAMTVIEFEENWAELKPQRKLYLLNFPGVYIFHNKTLDKHYIGQSTAVGRRIKIHLNGKGNKNLYEDYKLGHEFTIRVAQFQGSGYYTLDKFEGDFIKKYQSLTNGYNKMRSPNN